MSADDDSDELALQATAPAPAPWQPASFLHYKIVGKLGQGGMGTVYKAEDQRLGRVVALKRLVADGGSNATARARLVREARTASLVNHPHIVTIYAIEETTDEAVLVMEYVEGETLAAAIARAPLPAEHVLALGAELADALACAHAAGIVHRDIKPGNVMLTARGAVLLDFGIAKATATHGAPVDTLTATGALVGTGPYMSPEQLRALPLDGRSDVFSLGALLYEAATARRAFPASDMVGLIEEITTKEPQAPRALVPSLPTALERAIVCALAKSPAQRFAGAAEMAAALRAALGAAPASSVLSSVAVLSFLDLSAAHDQQHLCDGVAEELITALGQVDGLRVAARSSSFALKSASVDARTAGARLGVDSVLEGAVRRAGDRLRVTVQLVDVADGYPRWSHRFDGAVADVFGVQDEIAAGVVGALRGFLGAEDQKALRRPETSPEAYEHFLRARQLLYSTTPKSLLQCEKTLARALELDPGYAPAYAMLAELHVWRAEWYGGGEPAADAADRASRKALDLAPGLAESHVARAEFFALRRQYDDAAREFAEAIRLNPRSFEAHYYFGRARFETGAFAEAVKLFGRAAELRIEDFQSPLMGAGALDQLGRRDEAQAAMQEGVRRAERLLELDPDNSRALSLGAPNLYDLGQHARAREWAARAIAVEPDDPMVWFNAACLYARGGDKEAALTALEQSLGRSFGKREWIQHDRDFDSLRDDPRFVALLAKLR